MLSSWMNALKFIYFSIERETFRITKTCKNQTMSLKISFPTMTNCSYQLFCSSIWNQKTPSPNEELWEVITHLKPPHPSKMKLFSIDGFAILMHYEKSLFGRAQTLAFACGERWPAANFFLLLLEWCRKTGWLSVFSFFLPCLLFFI